MTPVDLPKHPSPLISSQNYADTLADITPGVEHEIVGLSKDADLDHYISDLEDLACQIYRYIELRERTAPVDLNLSVAKTPISIDLLALLQRITNNVKNLAVLYTDCINEAHGRFRETQRDIKTQLHQYPEAIAQLQCQVLKADQQVRQISESVAVVTAVIDRQVAFDSSLKNDAQRKAKRAELIESNPNYMTASIALKSVQDHREELLIQLQLIRSKFSVRKLQVREAVVRQELTAIDAA